MFDDQIKKDTPEVEDMFASTDATSDVQAAPSVPDNLPFAPTPAAQAAPKPQTPVPAPAAPEAAQGTPKPQATTQEPAPSMGTVPPSPPKSDVSNVFKVIVIVIVAIAIITAAGYLAYRLMTQDVDTDAVVDEVLTEEVDEDESGKVVEDVEVVDGSEEDEELEDLDTDGDGLTDAEEIEAGTDLENVDTDQDGLGDREEVQVYGTDPFDADTDKDGFLDGQEVAAGYNPNGEGKLFDLPK